MKRATALFVLALVATSLQAQQQKQQAANRGSITGVVKDAATGAPLGNVSVAILGTSRGATTNSDGAYAIPDLPAGIVTLQASRIGYTIAQVADFRVRAGAPSIKDIALTVQAIRLSSDLEVLSGKVASLQIRGGNQPAGDLEIVRGQAAAALYGQRTGTASYACDDPLKPRDAPACVLRPTRPGEDAYSQFLFAPELVMKNQGQIGLTDAQRTKIIGEMSQAQSKFTEIQWTLSGEEEKLNRLLQGPAPNEQSVIAQMDRILAMEENIKRTQMVLLVRIKNVLTPEQQATLWRLRE